MVKTVDVGLTRTGIFIPVFTFKFLKTKMETLLLFISGLLAFMFNYE